LLLFFNYQTKAGPACELCELVLTAAESQIKKNASEASFFETVLEFLFNDF
jgi:hypothetical protein